MSVLSVPRLFFRGEASWNPATLNNNDQWETVDVVGAELNWPFLGQQTPPITPGNARLRFPEWARTLRWYGGGQGGWYQPPAEWNYYGGNEVALHTASARTVVTGTQLDYNGPVLGDHAEEALVGAYVDLAGDSYPGSAFAGAARVVDVNPDSFWSTCVFLRRVQIGDDSAPGALLDGEVAPGTFMTSAWLNLERNLDRCRDLELAAVGGAVFQACLPGDTLRLPPTRSSPWAARVERELRRPEVAGLMVRMSAYLTRYFPGEAFRDCQGRSARYTRLCQLWDEQLAGDGEPEQNPAVSRVLGTVGLWIDREPVGVPAGRLLTPRARVVVEGAPAPLGPAVAEVHAPERVVSVDLGATVPERDGSGAKADVGPLSLVLEAEGGASTVLATLEHADYAAERYEATAGIVDVCLPAGVDGAQIAAGTLRLVAGAAPAAALEEEPLTAHPSPRGVWLDQGATATVAVDVRHKGAVPEPEKAVLLRLAQYVPEPPPPCPHPRCWVAATETSAVVGLPGADLAVCGEEQAQVHLTPLRPGFATVVVLPYAKGEAPPDPPPVIQPLLAKEGATRWTTTTAFFWTVRVLPFDGDLPARFDKLARRCPNAAWPFLYKHVLCYYDAVYPAMRYAARLDLGDRDAVERNIGRITDLVDHPIDSTVRMPVTRELSAGKREVIRRYRDLVAPPGAGAP